MRLLLYSCASPAVARVSTCAIFANEPSIIPRCAHDTWRVGEKSSAVWDLVRRAAREVAESRVQIKSAVSGFAHESCNDSGFAAGTSSSRATVRRTPNCFTAHISKLAKRKQCVLYAISFTAVNGAKTVFGLSRADIFFTSISSRESQELAAVVLETRRCNNLRLVAVSAHSSASRGCCSRYNSNHSYSSRLHH